MEKLKGWFESNYLDGDEIQEGQTFSSSFAFEAVQEAFKQGVEVVTLAKDCEDDIWVEVGGSKEWSDGWNAAVSQLEAFKASLLNPAAARVAGDMGMQIELANE